MCALVLDEGAEFDPEEFAEFLSAQCAPVSVPAYVPLTAGSDNPNSAPPP